MVGHVGPVLTGTWSFDTGIVEKIRFIATSCITSSAMSRVETFHAKNVVARHAISFESCKV